MLFNSLEFGIFFIIVTGAFFALPHRYRWFMLLAASCYFYMAFIPVYIFILFFTITVDYIAGILIEAAQGSRRKWYLVLSIVANVGVLAVFKYFNFLNGNFAGLAGFLDWNYPIENLSIILPIGLSFHTFQSLSYTVEVYRGRQKAERHLGIFALYVMFYPQLVAGPIERPQNMLHQFYEKHTFDYDRVVSGLKQMAWGFFKKLVIADKAAIFVNAIYNNPTEHTGFPLILATYLFAFQIYCDFSGYSDIAIGAARVMGFKLMDNFKSPYLSKSISEFWGRWHISLSTWFRDYLYIPLGGNRVAKWRWLSNLLIVFLVSGLWHGANWTFVVWGGLHGLYTILAIILRAPIEKGVQFLRLNRAPYLRDGLSIMVTFHAVVLAWIFFRANSLGDAFYIVTHLFTDVQLRSGGYGIGLGVLQTAILFLAILVMVLAEIIIVNKWVVLSKQPAWARWSVYYALVTLIVLAGEFEAKSQFIYFQF
jgi:alginate O-acetyltransferase complex protein AlgI